LTVCCLNLCTWPLIASFLKNAEWRAPYLASVCVLSVLFILALEHWTKLSLAGLSICTALGGEVCGIVALQFAKIFDRISGFAAFTKNSTIEVLTSIVTIDALVAALLGSWQTTLIAALVLRTWASKLSHQHP
jgi:hypothetical protein